MDFDQLLHSLLVAKGPTSSRRWWRRPTTIGAAAIVALSATAAGAVSSDQSAVAHKHPLTQTFTASAWPDLVQRSGPAIAPTPAVTAAGAPAPAGPVVGAVNLCTGTRGQSGPALTGFSPSAANGTTVVLADASTGSSALNSLVPTITSAIANATNSLGLPLPTLPATPLPTTTIPSNSSLNGGGSGSAASGSSQAASESTTTTTTLPPASPTPPSTSASPLPGLGDPNLEQNDSNIGCDLIGSGTVGGVAPGETAAEASAVSYAIALLGIPYQWGGESTSGFDCSGMAQFVYREVGVFLPRVAQDQYDVGPSVPPGATVEPGDLVFFGSGANDVSHVGMYAGDGLMIDAPHTGAVVRFDRIAGFEQIVGVTSPGQG